MAVALVAPAVTAASPAAEPFVSAFTPCAHLIDDPAKRAGSYLSSTTRHQTACPRLRR